MGCILALAYAQNFPDQVMKMVSLALPCYRNEAEARERIKQSSLCNRLLAMDAPLARIACAVMCHLRPFFMAIAPMLAHDIPAVVAKDALQHTGVSYSRTMRYIIFQAPVSEWLRAIPHSMLIIQGTVITLSAKADSFSGHAPPSGARSVLKARSEPQNIVRGVQVAICHIAAVGTAMHPIRQRLGNRGQRTAATTCLRRVVGWNRNHCHTSFFRFVRQDLQK